MRGTLAPYAASEYALIAFACLFSLTAAVCPSEHAIKPCKCFERGEEIQIWCSFGDLPKLAESMKTTARRVPGHLDELILENNILPALPGQLFPSEVKILRLMLRENGLQRISSNWLSGLESNLQEIYIVEPELSSFPGESILTLPKLEALTLSAGGLVRIPPIFGLARLKYVQIEAPAAADLPLNAFQGLPFLEQLHVTSAPKLKKLQGEMVRDLPNLAVLNFTKCGLEWIHPRALTRLPALTDLSFAGNKFSDARYVGLAIRDLPNLSTVRLDGNKIEAIDEATFVDISSLRHLHLNGNRIQRVMRAAFHRLPSLRSLDLSDNRIRSMHPEAFVNDDNLEDLWLGNNGLEHSIVIRTLLETLPRLRFLDLSGNGFQELSYGSVRAHAHLEILHLHGNKIERIGRDAFARLPSLRELKLDDNRLSYHTGTPYWQLPALKGLDLSGNKFEHIDTFVLHGLPALRRFDISRNSLKNLDVGTFSTTPYLEHVNVSRNGLTILHPLTFHHLQRLFDLDVSHNNLTQALTELPKNIEYLYMNGNKLTMIPTTAVNEFQLPSLKFLDLSDNLIHHIPAKSFNNLNVLRTLALNKNSLQKVDQHTFESLPQLRVLNLADNKLIMLHADAFKKLKHLTDLKLSGNRLEILEPSLLSQNSELKTLDLSDNRLSDSEQMTFSSNKKLEELNVSRNFLADFPSALSSMTAMQILDLHKNLLKSVPRNALPQMTSLRELNLAGNKIAVLSPGIFEKLQNLTILNLSENNLEQLPSHAIRSLPHLTSVDFSKNKLTSIRSSALVDLPSLQSVELQSNQLTDIAGDAFTACPYLAMLNLSDNLLASAEKAGVNALENLEGLDLSRNRIVTFDTDSVRDLKFLILLNLDNNRLCNIEGTPFEKLSRLRVLSLRDNKMTSLAEETFSKLRSSIAFFDIEGNPVHCSCNMLWLQSWLQQDQQRSPGPRCSDGILLREHHIARSECGDFINETVPGCENVSKRKVARTTTPPSTSSSSPSTIVEDAEGDKEETTPSLTATTKPHLPLPDESDFFDPKFVQDENVTKIIPPGVLSHYIAGDTPTLYAGQRHRVKGKNSTNEQGGPLTFFGVPVPSLNLNDFWNNGKTADDKQYRKGGRRDFKLPNAPEVQKGGFVPLLAPNDSRVKIKPKGLATIAKVASPSRPEDSSKESLSEKDKDKENHRVENNNRNMSVDAFFDSSANKDAKISTTTVAPFGKSGWFFKETTTSSSFNQNAKGSIRVADKYDSSSANSSELEIPYAPYAFPSPLSGFHVPGGEIPKNSRLPENSAVDEGDIPHTRFAKSPPHPEQDVVTSPSLLLPPAVINPNSSWYFSNYNRSNIEPYVGGQPVKRSKAGHPLPALPLMILTLFKAISL